MVVTTQRVLLTSETVESFGVGYGQGAGTSTGDWMKPPGDLFLYCDMKDLGADMVFTSNDDVISYPFSFSLPPPLTTHIFFSSAFINLVRICVKRRKCQNVYRRGE